MNKIISSLFSTLACVAVFTPVEAGAAYPYPAPIPPAHVQFPQPFYPQPQFLQHQFPQPQYPQPQYPQPRPPQALPPAAWRYPVAPPPWAMGPAAMPPVSFRPDTYAGPAPFNHPSWFNGPPPRFQPASPWAARYPVPMAARPAAPARYAPMPYRQAYAPGPANINPARWRQAPPAPRAGRMPGSQSVNPWGHPPVYTGQPVPRYRPAPPPRYVTQGMPTWAPRYGAAPRQMASSARPFNPYNAYNPWAVPMSHGIKPVPFAGPGNMAVAPRQPYWRQARPVQPMPVAYQGPVPGQMNVPAWRGRAPAPYPAVAYPSAPPPMPRAIPAAYPWHQPPAPYWRMPVMQQTQPNPWRQANRQPFNQRPMPVGMTGPQPRGPQPRMVQAPFPPQVPHYADNGPQFGMTRNEVLADNWNMSRGDQRELLAMRPPMPADRRRPEPRPWH